jgi:hypothetical protein
MISLQQALRTLLRSMSAYDAFLDGPSGHQEHAHDTHARAEQLLMRHLSPLQRDQYRKRGWFDVVGGDTNQRYRIQRGHQMNIEVRDQSGGLVQVLCFTPEGHLPVGDVLLAQKFALELFEADTLKIANRSPVWGYPPEHALRHYR